MATRPTTDIEQAYEWNLWMLKLLCKHFDEGNIQAALWIGVVLRTLLRDTAVSHSILQQKGDLDTLQFVSSAFSQGGVCGWNVDDGVSNISVIDGAVYAGLVRKKVELSTDGSLLLDFEPMLDFAVKKNQLKSAVDWKSEVVFKDGNVALTREQVIQNVANKDGGAHFDMNIPNDYASFRELNSLRIQINGQVAVFRQNPVYVSLRQIAWEVLESLTEK